WIGRHWRSCTPMPLGSMWVAASIGWRSARTAIRSLYGGSDVLPRIYGRWRFGWWRKECGAWPCNRRGCTGCRYSKCSNSIIWKCRIGAILEGERNPEILAALVQPGVKATPADILKSLEGNWRKELLFVLRQQVELYRMYQEKIDDCDQQLREHLESFGSVVDLQAQPIGPKPKGKKGSKNAPQFDLRTELYRITGIDSAQVNGIDVLTAQTVIAECGADLSAFPSEKRYTSWLGLVPTNEQSGGKILRRRTRKVVNRAAAAFRNAATTLLRSESYLGAQY